MQHNDVLRSLRYLLNAGESALVDLVKLADPAFEVKADDFVGYLRREDEAGYVACPDAVLARLLDGVVFARRGKDDTRPVQPFARVVTNNLVLKKLRVAYELKEDDLRALLKREGFEISKPELSAVFRAPEHKNYRDCGDQLLRNFLRGLGRRCAEGGNGGNGANGANGANAAGGSGAAK